VKLRSLPQADGILAKLFLENEQPQARFVHTTINTVSGWAARVSGCTSAGLQAADGLHLVGDKQLDGGEAGGDLPQVATGQADQGAVGQVHALAVGDQVGLVGVALQVAAQRLLGEVVADAVVVARAQGGWVP
jgi:hypothetical protein